MSTQTDSDHHHHHYGYIILGIVASIFLWISAWELASVLVPKQMKVKIYSVVLVLSLGLMYWLAGKNPKIIGFSA